MVPTTFGTNLLDGISFRAEGLPPLFFMNKEVPGDRFRFSLAHELGHMVMSIKSLIRRAYDLKLITNSQYQNLNAQYSKMVKEEEPVPIEMERSTRLQKIINYHRENLGYSIEELAQLLSLYPRDVETHYLPSRRGPRLVVSH